MAITNLSSKLTEFRKLCTDRAVTVVSKSLIRTGTSIIVESPVDKGRFAANWMFAFGAADESTKDGTFDGQAEKNGSTTRLYKSISGLELGQVFFMTNSLSYSQRLEDGWSAKSSKMVARAVNNFPAVLSEEVAKAK